MVGIADRECIGQRVVEGNVGAIEVAHRQRRLLLDPGIPALPGLLRSLPRMVGANRQRARVLDVEMEGQDLAAGGVGLMPDRQPGRQGDGARIVKAAYARQGAKIVIEGAILLHEDHHVFDIGQGAGNVVGLHGQRVPYETGKHRCACRRCGHAEKTASACRNHAVLRLSREAETIARQYDTAMAKTYAKSILVKLLYRIAVDLGIP